MDWTAQTGVAGEERIADFSIIKLDAADKNFEPMALQRRAMMMSKPRH